MFLKARGVLVSFYLTLKKKFQDLSIYPKTGLGVITITLKAGGRKRPWVRVVKIMGPVLGFPKCEQYLIRLCFTAGPEGKVL